MTTFPSFESYRDLFHRFDIVPVYRRLLSDHLTPVSAFRLLDDGTSSAGIFESVIGGEKIGRYSFIAVGPRARVVAYGTEVSFHRDQTVENFQCDDPLEFLSEQLGNQSIAPVPELPPFVGGAIGYASYDVVRYVENLPNPPEDDRKLPDLDFGFYDQLVIFDHVNKTIMVVVLSHSANGKSANGKCNNPLSPEIAYREASGWIDRIVERLDQPLPQHSLADIPLTYTPTLNPKSNFSKEGFQEAVLKCRQYIEAGDIFQVVLSQRFEIQSQSEPIEIFRTLRVINPSPFMFLLRTPECTLVGSSPEVMARVVDRVVTVRPLAGTRPRGKSSEEDGRLSEELLADPKERAPNSARFA